MYSSKDETTLSLTGEIETNFPGLDVTNFYFVLYKDNNNYIYGELNSGDFSVDNIPNIGSLVNSLKFPTDIITNCPQLKNYGDVIQ